MKLLNLRSRRPWQRWVRAPGVQSISQASWPILAGLCAGIVGLLMLGASWHFQRQARQSLVAMPPTLSKQSPGQRASSQLPPSLEATFAAPDPSTHLDDLARLFKLARDQGVSIGTIEYRFEASTALPLLVRTLDLHINEDYSKLKSLVAEVLSTMSHVSLQEIRVERKDASSAQQQIMLKLSFVYQTVAKSSAVLP